MTIKGLAKKLKTMGFKEVNIKRIERDIVEADNITFAIPKEFGIIVNNLLIIPSQDGLQLIKDAQDVLKEG